MAITTASVTEQRMTPTDPPLASLRAARLRSHLLATPAADIRAAASHMAAIQSQELWGGRLALSARTVGAPTAREVDDAFDRGEIVRTWPMRGTLHTMAAEDVGWMLPISAERVHRSAATRHRQLGLDADDFHRGERLVRGMLADGGLPRREVFAGFAAGGLDPSGQRGAHLLVALAIRGVAHWGAVVDRAPRAGSEQLFTLNDTLPPQREVPGDATAELLRRYLAGHAPASVSDFAWWVGLPITAARAALRSVLDQDDLPADQVLLDVVGEHIEPFAPRVDDAPRGLLLLPTFEESYLSYADRSVMADEAARAAIGPGRNGMIKAIIVRDGVVVATWTRAGVVSAFDAVVDVQDALSRWERHSDV